MEKIAIMTDSNSGLTPEQARDEHIFLLPMPFTVDGKECLEYRDLTQEQFYQHQAAGANIFSSQPAPADLVAMWDDILSTHDQLIYIPMTSGLSGSCQTAKSFSEDYGGRIIVVDNHRISVPQKQSVLEAARLRTAGRTAKEIVERLMEKAMQARVYITVEDLNYLKKGGRITPAVAAVGTVLNIKPVMKIYGGQLDMYHKVRGMKQARQTMLDAVRQDLESDCFREKRVIVAAAFSGDRAAGEEWAQVVHETFPGYPFLFDPLPLSIGCHTGPGALGAGLMLDFDET